MNLQYPSVTIAGPLTPTWTYADDLDKYNQPIPDTLPGTKPTNAELDEGADDPVPEDDPTTSPIDPE